MLVGPGVRVRAVEWVKRVSPSGRCCLISDDTVAALWQAEVKTALESGGLAVTTASFPAGEVHKTRATWGALTDCLVDMSLGRDGCVVSLGGGVVGDLAGFVAATYLRGIPWLNLPTTTLAMIDASVGGKTGVDHAGGKNLVGAFHAPRAVLADTDFLSTLPRADRARGYAEALKHGAILDREHFDEIVTHASELLEGETDITARVIARSVDLKAGVVSKDEFESGFREVLNFGHTIAHALERVTDFNVSHGDAVAVGMVAEARMGEGLGISQAGTAEALAAAAARLELPIALPEQAQPEGLAVHARRDKKVRGGQVRIVCLDRIGQAHGDEANWSVPLPEDALVRLLQGDEAV